MDKIIATNNTIRQIVMNELKKLGNNADLNHIDTSNVTDMSRLFANTEFNGDISKWDVKNVTFMSFMFLGSQFNGDISKWDVKNVKSMWSMFERSQFNGDISKWDVKNVKDMQSMFTESKFNGDISKWDLVLPDGNNKSEMWWAGWTDPWALWWDFPTPGGGGRR